MVVKQVPLHYAVQSIAVITIVMYMLRGKSSEVQLFDDVHYQGGHVQV